MLNRHMAALRELLVLEMLDFAGSDARESLIALRETRVPQLGSE